LNVQPFSHGLPFESRGLPVSTKSSATHPFALAVQPENIPAELKSLNNWLVWRWAKDKKKARWSKPPINARTLETCDGTAPENLSVFQTAITAYQNKENRLDGIGLALTPALGIVAVDLDDCRNHVTGELTGFAQSIVSELNSYAEVSPSGEGLRVFVRGTLPGNKGRKDAEKHIELCNDAAYVTVTGIALPKEYDENEF
jgi:primase-polymerase (primpol)-like protein